MDIETVKNMVDIFMERGFAYFDTAHRYNDEASEPAIREALVKRYPRDRYILTNKMTLNYIKKPEQQEPFFKKQLSICGVDYFDNYLIHNMGAVWYPLAERFGTFDFLRRMRDAGLFVVSGFPFTVRLICLKKSWQCTRKPKSYSFKSTTWIGMMRTSNRAVAMKQPANSVSR